MNLIGDRNILRRSRLRLQRPLDHGAKTQKGAVMRRGRGEGLLAIDMSVKTSSPTHDLIIAATAISLGFCVLNLNLRNFERIEGLTVERVSEQN